MTPCFLTGGTERWVVLLCKHLGSKFKVVEISTINDTDDVAASWIPQGVKFSTDRRVPDCDVLITWGFTDLSSILQDQGFKGVSVSVQHVSAKSPWLQATIDDAVQLNSSFGTHLVAVSEECRSNFRCPEQVTVINNGAEDPTCQKTKEESRESLGIDLGKKVALCVGRVSSQKNTAAFIDAVNELGPDWVGISLGPAQRVKRGAAPIKFRGNVAHRDPADVAPYLRASDVLVHPSDHESHCFAINEAWLARLPVVSCAYPANLRFQRDHGFMSVLVNVRPKPSELAQAIRYAVNTEASVLDRVRDTALNHYTAEIMGRSWSRYLSSLCGRP